MAEGGGADDEVWGELLVLVLGSDVGATTGGTGDAGRRICCPKS